MVWGYGVGIWCGHIIQPESLWKDPSLSTRESNTPFTVGVIVSSTASNRYPMAGTGVEDVDHVVSE